MPSPRFFDVAIYLLFWMLAHKFFGSCLYETPVLRFCYLLTNLHVSADPDINDINDPCGPIPPDLLGVESMYL